MTAQAYRAKALLDPCVRLGKQYREVAQACEALNAVAVGDPEDPIDASILLAGKRQAMWEAFCAARRQVLPLLEAAQLTPLQARLLSHRYLRCCKWDEVCERIGCSERHAMREHAAALEAVGAAMAACGCDAAAR